MGRGVLQFSVRAFIPGSMAVGGLIAGQFLRTGQV